jgi:hypothetical protein
MSIVKRAGASSVLFLIAGLFALSPAQASYVSALSEMAVSNLQFSPTDPAAQLLWTDVWYGEVRAHAQDSDSAPADDYNELLGNDGSVQATADTAHVDSKATYDVTDGDLVALDPSGQIGATTHSGLLLTQPNKQGDGFATSDFDNYFMVTGGATGESVEVTFTLD